MFERVKSLKREYLKQIEHYRRLGYSKPEYKAAEPKWKAYQLMFKHGISIDEAVRIFKEIDPYG